MLHDTIAAVSTPYGKGGIAVIRISGDNTAAVLQGCFSTSGPNPVENPRRACLGTIMQNGIFKRQAISYPGAGRRSSY